MNYAEFFHCTTGHQPFEYQIRLGEETWPDLIQVPTGLGKTASIVVAWLWKRLSGDESTPTRLAYCLPMRVLAEQTHECATLWIEHAKPYLEARTASVPTVHLLMGGESEFGWAENPEAPSIVIGTQDMLLSRALMRGYGMSRYQWPVHFAMLQNDTLWVFDEVQLMGAGLPTSAQMEAFRRNRATARPTRSLWMSATLNPDWLATVDLNLYLGSFRQLGIGEEESRSDAVRVRREAVKRLQRAKTGISPENQKQAAKEYAKMLALEVAENHVRGTTTLVVVNTVERCQAVLKALDQLRVEAETFLVHSRFRPDERHRLNKKLMTNPESHGPGRIIVATQAVEAGVDMTSRVLFTELAPWSSLVQRFGRCNRYGEAGSGGAQVFWIDLELEKALANPYDTASLSAARHRLEGLESASPADLPRIDEKAPLHPVIRSGELHDLFNTDPDLSGFDVDISPYIRDADDLDLQLLWRDLAQRVEDQPLPGRNELCRASISQVKGLQERMRKADLRFYRWDSLDGRWRVFQNDLRPGLILMLDQKAGGYSERFGLDPSSRESVASLDLDPASGEIETYGGDERSRRTREVRLVDHLGNVTCAVRELCRSLDCSAFERRVVEEAAAWHDVGKAHPIFQTTMHGCSPEDAAGRVPLLAKSPLKGSHPRKHFRHELASMLAWLTHQGDKEDADLIAYLIAAHHGKVRISLRSVPEEIEPTPPLGPRFARGVWENDVLPELDLGNGRTVPSTMLRLEVMELGDGDMGPSWTARTQRLLHRYGPFQLAWLESLVRVADWRASMAEQEEQDEA